VTLKELNPLPMQIITFSKKLLAFITFSIIGTALYAQHQGNKAELQKHFDKVYASIVEEHRYVASLNNNTIDLPVGIKKTIDSKDFIVCIDSIIITPKRAYASLFCIVENTKCKNEKLYFYDPDVELNSAGSFSFDEEDFGRLPLLNDYSFYLGKNKCIFRSSTNILKGSFVLFDCNGFKQMQLAAEFTLLPNEAHLVDFNGNNKGPITISSTFILNTFDEIYFSVDNLGMFELDYLPGFTFDPKSMVIDFSSLKSYNDIKPPKGYMHYDSKKSPLWEGVYIPAMKLYLPECLSKKSVLRNGVQKITSARNSMVIPVEGAIIDNMGFSCSGELQSSPLSYKSNNNTISRFDEWPVSIDNFTLSICAGTFNYAKFTGIVKLPIAQEENLFDYIGTYVPYTGYRMSVNGPESSQSPHFGAKRVTLHPNSIVTVKEQNNMLQPTAIFNGSIANSSKSGVEEFKSLRISNKIVSYLDADAVLKQEPNPPAIVNFYSIDGINCIKFSNGKNSDIQKTTVYKRLKGETNWHKYAEIKKDTAEITLFTDTLVTKQFWYEYALEVENSKGLKSGMTEKITIQVSDNGEKPAIERFYVLPNKRRHAIHLTWEYNENGVNSYVIYKAGKDGLFTVLKNIDGTSRDYIDYSSSPGEGFSYVIKAIFSDNTQSPSTLKRVSNY